MSNKTSATSVTGELFAAEALRYLEVVETFAALDADPHAAARERATRRRATEDEARPRVASLGRKPILRWKR